MQISARQQQNLGVRTADVARRTLAQKLSAFGTVAIDERSVETVPALASGLIEKLYVNASQQFVKERGAGRAMDPAVGGGAAGVSGGEATGR